VVEVVEAKIAVKKGVVVEAKIVAEVKIEGERGKNYSLPPKLTEIVTTDKSKYCTPIPLA
jgi:hypothetical protein